MGKGTRKREAKIKQAKLLRQQEAKAIRKRKKTTKTIIISIVAFVLIVSSVIGIFTAVVAVRESGILLRNKVSIVSDNYKVDNAMLSFFIYNNYASFMNSYGSFATYYINPSYSLKSQECSISENHNTWFDYFADNAAKQVKQYLILCENAIKENIALNDIEKQTVELQMKTLDINDYPEGLKEEDLRKCFEMIALATKYSNVLKGRYEITDDDIEKYYLDNIDNYRLTDYRSYYFEFKTSSDTSGSNTSASSDKMDKEEAKKLAEELKAFATSEDKFVEWVKEYIKDDYTDDAKLTEALDKTLTEQSLKTPDNKPSEWMYNSETKEGDTYIHESDKGFTVYYLVKAPYKDTTITKTVRHILLTKDQFGTLDLAKAKAESIVEEFKKNPSEENFIKEVHKYSEDIGSALIGGLFENVYLGEMVEEFETWCFDKDRKEGDVGIVKSTYGYHIIYFVGDGLETWAAHCHNAKLSELYSKDAEELEKKTPITIKKDVINSIGIF